MKTINKISILLLTLLLVFTSCEVAPKKINYGNDHCLLCDMTVVDKAFSAQYVTKKGKAYMFDSVECLVRKVTAENNEDLLAFVLVSDYKNPGSLTNAYTATYLISEKIKSPMGANLSAFSSKKDAMQVHNEFGGELFTWNEIKAKLLK
ncbi:MAG: nitrous oxide reductase accessory protein NosL [Polaribacter sp.]|nr:nitrous oxide reductase accessory protein NosL [Polaribacter sp.]